jgi:hypothetical protein
MNYTDTQLQQVLAKILPNKVEWNGHYLGWWQPPALSSPNKEVTNDQLLDLCWQAEETFWNDPVTSASYCYELDLLCQPRRDEAIWGFGYTGFITHATWRQRLVTMAKVLKLEIPTA